MLVDGRSNKKIGIVTTHRAISYGAGLQAYALQTYIQHIGYNVEIIDYVPRRFSFKYIVFVQPKRTNGIKRIIKFFPYVVCKIMQYLVVRRFNGRFLLLSEKAFFTEKDLAQGHNDYDMLVTGSDQVWNLELDDWKNIKPYVLSFDMKTKKISYAASLGYGDIPNIDDSVLKEFKSLLADYAEISVRESSGEKMLNDLGIKAHTVLDPTFLLNAEDWRSISKKPRGFLTGSYILVYGLYRNKNIYKLAQRLSVRLGCKIVNIADSFDFCKEAINDIIVTHENLLWYIDNAECVLTDSFHGLALSLNLSKQFYVFEAKRYNERILNLVGLLDLRERYVSSDINVNDINLSRIDYEDITLKLQKERIKSDSFVRNALFE